MTLHCKSGVMDISVVLCAYNEEKYIYNCLKSLAEQKQVFRSNYEVIVVDDDSQDQTANIVKNFLKNHHRKFPLFRYIKIKHRGLSVARNTGLLAAKAPLIAYIDADVVADENWLFELLNAWKIHPDSDSIGGRIKILNYHNRLAQLLHDAFYDQPDKTAIIGANMSFKRQRLLDIGGFCDTFVSRGDETCLFRKMSDNAKFEKCLSAVIYHKRPDSILSWLNERISNGYLIMLIETMFKPKYPLLKKFAVKYMIKTLIGLPLLATIVWKWPKLFLVILLMALLRWKSFQVWQDVFSLRREKYGLINALIAGYGVAILEDLGNIMFSIGIIKTYSKKYFKNNNTSLSYACGLISGFIVKELDSGNFARKEEMY